MYLCIVSFNFNFILIFFLNINIKYIYIYPTIPTIEYIIVSILIIDLCFYFLSFTLYFSCSCPVLSLFISHAHASISWLLLASSVVHNTSAIYVCCLRCIFILLHLHLLSNKLPLLCPFRYISRLGSIDNKLPLRTLRRNATILSSPSPSVRHRSHLNFKPTVLSFVL